MVNTTHRLDQISALIQKTLAQIIQQELPDLKSKWITLTRIKVSADLAYAKVYIVTHKPQDMDEAINALKESAKFLRTKLAKSVKLRKVPLLEFFRDEAVDTGERISKLLKDIDE